MTGLNIHIRDKTYPAVDGARPARIFQDFRLTAAEGAFVCLFGPSGCGKTTLLNIVAGLDGDYQGDVRFPNAAGTLRIGYVFQQPRLLPWRTVAANVRLPIQDDPERLSRVDDLLVAVGLGGLAGAYPRQLSAGQARRAALARAFAVEPDLMLLDEPFVSLDDLSAEGLRQTLLEVWSKRPTTVLFVTHNLEEAMSLADRVLLLSDSPVAVLADAVIEVPRDARGDSAEIARQVAELDGLRRRAALAGGGLPQNGGAERS